MLSGERSNLLYFLSKHQHYTLKSCLSVSVSKPIQGCNPFFNGNNCFSYIFKLYSQHHFTLKPYLLNLIGSSILVPIFNNFFSFISNIFLLPLSFLISGLYSKAMIFQSKIQYWSTIQFSLVAIFLFQFFILLLTSVLRSVIMFACR